MPQDYSREVRFGLVMYGGVSLAVYINGVTQEFFRVAHGRGIYKLIEDLTDSEFVVDTVSGTSAGGINGIYLIYALSNGLDFNSMSQLWRESGDIDKLLQDPRLDPVKTESLLKSDWYLEQLVDAFTSMPADSSIGPSEPRRGWPGSGGAKVHFTLRFRPVRL